MQLLNPTTCFRSTIRIHRRGPIRSRPESLKGGLCLNTGERKKCTIDGSVHLPILPKLRLVVVKGAGVGLILKANCSNRYYCPQRCSKKKKIARETKRCGGLLNDRTRKQRKCAFNNRKFKRNKALFNLTVWRN